MRNITCWNDLRPFGIDVLTGEACGLSYRMLCDVTEKGKRTIQKALGIANLGLPENWNRGDPGDPHIGAIMLAPELLVPLAVFALWNTAAARSGAPSPAISWESSRRMTQNE